MMWFIGFVLAFGAILLDGLYFLNAWTWFVVPLGIPRICSRSRIADAPRNNARIEQEDRN